jgi:hypothetical protein
MDYVTAWENRDSSRVDSVLADDYQGTSTDLASGTPEVLTFTRSDEIRAVHGLRDDANLTLVDVNLGPSGSWTRTSYIGDPPDWAVMITPHVQVILRFVNGDEVVVNPAQTSNEFKLKPVATLPDTIWEIVRWSEMHN